MIIVDVPHGSPEWHRARHGVVTASAIDQLLVGGGEGKIPKYFGRSPMPGVAPPTKRAPSQLVVWEALADGPQPLASSSGLNALRARKAVVEYDPPPDAKPPHKPIMLSPKRDAYMARLLHEWCTGSDGWEPLGSKRWIEHGHACEGEAADYFAWTERKELRPGGLVYRDESRTAACSPDALVYTPDMAGVPEKAPAWRFPSAGLELKCPAGWTHIRYLRAGVMPPDYVPQVQFSLWVTGLSRWYFMSYARTPEDPLLAWRPGTSMPPLLLEVEPDPRWQDAFDEHVPTFVAEMLAAREELLAMGVRAAE